MNRTRLLMLLASCTAVLGLSACAVGLPKPVTRTGITSVALHGNVYSTLDGDTQYWWRYGPTPDYGLETPRRTVTTEAYEASVVSEPLTGLTPGATYHFQFCVKDALESPERICSPDHDFVANPPEGRIAFIPGGSHLNYAQIHVMFEDGSNPTLLTYDRTSNLRPSWSPDGETIAFMSTRDDTSGSEIYVMDADGDPQTALTHDGAFADDPAWSPDGARIAFTSDRSGDVEIYTMDADGGDLTRLTNSPGVDSQPAWSPDGSRIAFTSERAGAPGGFEIYSMNADGSLPSRLTNNSDRDEHPDWSPDGDRIAFTSGDGPASEIHVMDADGDDEQGITENTVDDRNPTWSPDGSRIAFTSLRDSGPNVWVMDADGANATLFIEGASYAYWWGPTSVPTATAVR
jgi:Tol biopolymer transport system component